MFARTGGHHVTRVVGMEPCPGIGKERGVVVEIEREVELGAYEGHRTARSTHAVVRSRAVAHTELEEVRTHSEFCTKLARDGQRLGEPETAMRLTYIGIVRRAKSRAPLLPVQRNVRRIKARLQPCIEMPGQSGKSRGLSVAELDAAEQAIVALFDAVAVETVRGEEGEVGEEIQSVACGIGASLPLVCGVAPRAQRDARIVAEGVATFGGIEGAESIDRSRLHGSFGQLARRVPS